MERSSVYRRGHGDKSCSQTGNCRIVSLGGRRLCQNAAGKETHQHCGSLKSHDHHRGNLVIGQDQGAWPFLDLSVALRGQSRLAVEKEPSSTDRELREGSEILLVGACDRVFLSAFHQETIFSRRVWFDLFH